MALVPTIEHRHPQRHQPTATAAPRPALASRYVPIVHGRRGRAECAGSGRAARPGTGTSAGVRHPVERQAADRRQDTSDTKHPATAAPAPNNDKPEPTCRWRRGWGHRGLRYPAIRPATSAMSITAGGAGWRRPCSASDCCRLRHPMGAELLAGSPRFQHLKLHLQRSRRDRCLSQLERGSWMGRIREHGHAGDSGNGLLEQLQPLADQLRREDGQPRDVSPRSRQAGHEPTPDRILMNRHDDGDR